MSHTTAEFEPLEPRWVPTSLLPGGTEPGHHADVSTEADQWSANAWALDTSFARTQYGLYGYGQTVAIIDSGIAYDHTALGRGFGPAHRVVGGWDFAENDANPYDDGPIGFHGTHVAGIVGSDHPTHTGVSPGVDLVSLRVFDDQGRSDVAWITSALWWVHAHRHSFEFPITTVNLSVGIASIDGATRAAVDSALQVLEQDGIFISVAAGNDFSGNTNVKYPASSVYATPVASVGPAGALSGFSMRNSRVLAAPGESIVSTVPDYLFGFDGVTDDFLAVSGTSMAAPHVAGASVLLRELHDKLGHSNLSQQQLYQEFVRNSDVIYDAATGANYWRLNLKKALEGALGPDEAPNTSIGVLRPTAVFSSTINTLSDVDTYAFTASQTGDVALRTTWTGPTNQRPSITVNGTTVSDAGQFQVQAGRTYTLSIAASGSIGKYNGQLVLTPQNSAVIAAAPSARANQAHQVWTAPATGLYDIHIHVPSPDRVDSIRVYGANGQPRYMATQIASEHQFQLQLAEGEQITFAMMGYSPAAEISIAALSVGQGGSSWQVAQPVLLVAAVFHIADPIQSVALTCPGELALEAEDCVATADEAFIGPIDPAWLDRVVTGDPRCASRPTAASQCGHRDACDDLDESLFADSLSLLVSLQMDVID